MANKARYYGLSTREEKQDVQDKSRAARIYPQELGYKAVVAAILNYKDVNSDFDEKTASQAAKVVAKMLTNTDLYGTVSSSSARVIGENYSVSLTKGDGIITVSHKTEQFDEEVKRKR